MAPSRTLDNNTKLTVWRVNEYRLFIVDDNKLTVPCYVHWAKPIFTGAKNILNNILVLGFNLDMTNGCWTFIFNMYYET